MLICSLRKFLIIIINVQNDCVEYFPGNHDTFFSRFFDEYKVTKMYLINSVICIISLMCTCWMESILISLKKNFLIPKLQKAKRLLNNAKK